MKDQTDSRWLKRQAAIHALQRLCRAFDSAGRALALVDDKEASGHVEELQGAKEMALDWIDGIKENS